MTYYAFYHIAREQGQDGFVPYVGRVGKNTHWWLYDTQNIRIIDPTACQFKNPDIRNSFYRAGKGCGFMTKEPSKRGQIIINHVKEILRNR